jgi:hypothetical protein
MIEGGQVSFLFLELLSDFCCFRHEVRHGNDGQFSHETSVSAALDRRGMNASANEHHARPTTHFFHLSPGLLPSRTRMDILDGHPRPQGGLLEVNEKERFLS